MQRQGQDRRQAVHELRRNGQGRPGHRRRLIYRVLATGAAASAASASAALACSHFENGHAARPMNAITHIYDGGEPPAQDGVNRRNTALGFAIHTAASIWWALFFEQILGRASRRDPAGPVLAAAGVSAIAYVVDYGVVGKRFRPGFERYLSRPSLFAVYAALALGFAASALLTARRHGARAAPRRRARRQAAAPA
jgi:hypothetical protein